MSWARSARRAKARKSETPPDNGHRYQRRGKGRSEGNLPAWVNWPVMVLPPNWEKLSNKHQADARATYRTELAYHRESTKMAWQAKRADKRRLAEGDWLLRVGSVMNRVSRVAAPKAA